MDVTKLSPELQKKLVDMVVDRKNYARDGKQYQHFATKYLPLYNAYKGIFTTQEKRQWRSKLFVMISYTTCETVKATLMQLLFKGEQWQRIKASETTSPDKELAMQSVMNTNLKKIKAKNRFIFQGLNYGIKYGTFFTRSYWDYKTMLKTKRFPKKVGDMIIGKNKETRREVISDFANFRVINPLLVYIDPKAHDLTYPEVCRYAIEEIPLDFNQLKIHGKTGFYQNLDKIEIGKDKNGNVVMLDLTVEAKFVQPDADEGIDDAYRNRVNLLDYWGKIDLPKWEGDDRPWNVVVANEGTLIRCEIPYDWDRLPIQLHRVIPEENRLYGIGVLETILADQYFMNQIVNQRLDNANILLNQMWIQNDQAFRNPDEAIEIIPGGRIRVNGMTDLNNAIRPVNMQDFTGGTFQQMSDWIDRDKQKTSGATDFTAGMIPTSGINQTATGVATLMEQANKRFGSMLLSLSDGLDDLLMSLMHLNQQYVSAERVHRIAGKRMSLKISPHDIEGEYELEALNTSVMTNEILAQLNINFLTAMSPYVQALREVGYEVNLPQIVKEIVYNFPGLNQRRNIMKKIERPPVPPAMPGAGAPGVPGGAPEVQQALQALAGAGGVA